MLFRIIVFYLFALSKFFLSVVFFNPEFFHICIKEAMPLGLVP